jgi:hypothetical protein
MLLDPSTGTKNRIPNGVSIRQYIRLRRTSRIRDVGTVWIANGGVLTTGQYEARSRLSIEQPGSFYYHLLCIINELLSPSIQRYSSDHLDHE